MNHCWRCRESANFAHSTAQEYQNHFADKCLPTSHCQVCRPLSRSCDSMQAVRPAHCPTPDRAAEIATFPQSYKANAVRSYFSERASIILPSVRRELKDRRPYRHTLSGDCWYGPDDCWYLSESCCHQTDGSSREGAAGPLDCI